MGMAASQARYLALVARKSNCEFEGQQINQARTALSNQSANLFNQMLGLKVPVPPSTQDFTKTQYSYKDGLGCSTTITDWQQLANDPEYNYVVTRYYNQNKYTGSLKKMSDPQVQFATGSSSTVEQIETALRLVTQTKKDYEEAKAATAKAKAEAATLTNYVDNDLYTHIYNSGYDPLVDTYTIQSKVQSKLPGTDNLLFQDSTGTQYYLHEDGNYYSVDGKNTPYAGDVAGLIPSMNDSVSKTFVGYSKLEDVDKQAVEEAIQKLIDEGALDKDITKIEDMADVYYNAEDGTISFKADLRNAGSARTVLPTYHAGNDQNSINEIAGKYDAQIAMLQVTEFAAQQAYEAASLAYEGLERPTYIGNSELTLLVDLTSDQAAELRQVVKDMQDQEANSAIENCFGPDGEYLGGIYQFRLNGVTYYTTYEDLNKSYESGTGINNIDAQSKLAYYNATYVQTKVEETQKALVETDGNGRFATIRFEDDSIVYTLNMETITDEKAYDDAMNQYYYDNAVYDKTIRDINAKTSIIQQEDQQLELRLKQLDTEQNALKTEMEAVQKVVKDNVESSFKTFGG